MMDGWKMGTSLPNRGRAWFAAGLLIATFLSLSLVTPRAEAQDEPPPQFGIPSRAELVEISNAEDGLDRPRDLAFNPDPERPDELWVVSRDDDSTVIYFDATDDEARRAEYRKDVWGRHFMEEVSSIDFGDNGNFATCHESRNTYDDRSPPDDFMGPTLWDADLEVYAKANQAVGELDMMRVLASMRAGMCRGDLGAPENGTAGTEQRRCNLGSHIDMNHQSPLCMGIAHHLENAYWVYDGMHGHIVYYDFVEDHGPGCDDHSDGIVRRYVEAEVSRVEDVPGHMLLDKDSGWLYYADPGSSRVMRMDTSTGEKVEDYGKANEDLAEFSEYQGATVEVFAEAGMVQPSGLALDGEAGTLFVSDHATGEILAFAIDGGDLLARLETGLESLMGLEIGPDGRLWMVDAASDRLLRLEPGTEPPTPTITPSPEPTATPEPFRNYLPILERS